jgi:glycosyltransferase involved in cell wall biosynthesis
VPVYNAENYIERCVESILTQTYTNYKLVVVDDQSTDNTNSIITEVYNKNNHNFTVCRLDNHYGSPIRSFKTGVDIFSNDQRFIGDKAYVGEAQIATPKKKSKEEN